MSSKGVVIATSDMFRDGAVFYIQTGMVKLTIVSLPDTKAVVAILERGALRIVGPLHGIITGSIGFRGCSRIVALAHLDPLNGAVLLKNPNAMHVTRGLSESDVDDAVQSSQYALDADQDASPHP
jgi:hypothetical protein